MSEQLTTLLSAGFILFAAFVGCAVTYQLVIAGIKALWRRLQLPALWED